MHSGWSACSVTKCWCFSSSSSSVLMRGEEQSSDETELWGTGEETGDFKLIRLRVIQITPDTLGLNRCSLFSTHTHINAEVVNVLVFISNVSATMWKWMCCVIVRVRSCMCLPPAENNNSICQLCAFISVAETHSSSSLFLSEIPLCTANELSFPFVNKSKPFWLSQFENTCKSAWKDDSMLEENCCQMVKYRKEAGPGTGSTPSAWHRNLTPQCNLFVYTSPRSPDTSKMT